MAQQHTAGYVQILAVHGRHENRALIRSSTGAHQLWFGLGHPVVDVPESLAVWLCSRPEMDVLDAPLMWFDPSTLPAAERFCRCHECSGD